jgi:hypothetical protein
LTDLTAPGVAWASRPCWLRTNVAKFCIPKISVIERRTHGQDARATGTPFEFASTPDIEKLVNLFLRDALRV